MKTYYDVRATGRGYRIGRFENLEAATYCKELSIEDGIAAHINVEELPF